MMFMSPDMHAKGFAVLGAWLLGREGLRPHCSEHLFSRYVSSFGQLTIDARAASSAFSEWSSVTEMAAALMSERPMLADKICQGFGVVVVAGAMASRSRNPGFVDAHGRSLQ
jgi:hypothetical protein